MYEKDSKKEDCTEIDKHISPLRKKDCIAFPRFLIAGKLKLLPDVLKYICEHILHRNPEFRELMCVSSSLETVDLFFTYINEIIFTNKSYSLQTKNLYVFLTCSVHFKLELSSCTYFGPDIDPVYNRILLKLFMSCLNYDRLYYIIQLMLTNPELFTLDNLDAGMIGPIPIEKFTQLII